MLDISAIEQNLNVRLVTGEYEIIAWLFRHGPTRSRELSMCTKVSLANFQITLRRLKDDNIVISIADEKDRRVRLFDLADEVRAECEAWFGGTTDCNLPSVTRAGRNGSAGLSATHG